MHLFRAEKFSISFILHSIIIKKKNLKWRGKKKFSDTDIETSREEHFFVSST